MRTILLIMITFFTSACTDDKTKLTNVNISSSSSTVLYPSPFNGFWKIFKSSTRRNLSGYIGIIKTGTDQFEVYYTENPNASSPKATFYGCVAAPGGRQGAIICEEGSKPILSIALTSNITNNFCSDPANPDSIDDSGIEANPDEAMNNGYRRSICFMMYETKGPGSGSGTAGNTGN